MRRFTRRMNAHSKKIQNYFAAIRLHFLHYNFARANTGLRGQYPQSPAMAAGLADPIWTVRELVERADAEGCLA